jgi:hypothetical protein
MDSSFAPAAQSAPPPQRFSITGLTLEVLSGAFFLLTLWFLVQSTQLCGLTWEALRSTFFFLTMFILIQSAAFLYNLRVSRNEARCVATVSLGALLLMFLVSYGRVAPLPVLLAMLWIYFGVTQSWQACENNPWRNWLSRIDSKFLYLAHWLLLAGTIIKMLIGPITIARTHAPLSTKTDVMARILASQTADYVDFLLTLISFSLFVLLTRSRRRKAPPSAPLQ